MKVSSNVQGTVNISQRDKVLLIIGLYCFIATAMLVVYEFTTGLPKILGELGGTNLVSYIFTANMLGAAIMSPIAGSLSHIYGRRRVLIAGVILLILMEVSAAFVTSVTQLIVLRGLQGVGGAFAITVSMIVIADVCTPTERAKYLGFYGSLMAAFMIVGPFLGGVIVDNFSWRLIFLSIIPIGLIGLFLVYRFMPVIPKSSESKIDILGSVVMAVTVSLVVLISVLGGQKFGWGSSTMLILYLATIVGLWLFVKVEQRAKTPIMPMSLFANPSFVIFFVAVFLITMASIPAAYYFPLYAQKVRGLSATYAGSLMAFKGIIALVSSAANGWIIALVKDFRWNALVIVLLLAIANFSYSMMDVSTAVVMIGVTMFVWGLSGGYSNVFHIGAQMNLSQTQIVGAMGALQLAVSLGATVGNIVIGIVLKNPDFTKGLQNVFLMGAALTLVVVLLVSVMLVKNKVFQPAGNQAVSPN